MGGFHFTLVFLTNMTFEFICSLVYDQEYGYGNVLLAQVPAFILL